ncbi:MULTISPECIES: tRNA epoxyqueuosine(34) reductase QueG [unclassified Methylophaga]|jgi:epoxyqueuosine reductase|uniref:tRNA epoxyqueuosine(34) reductase QueG n=1 Tax=unclassified Methylophaga TaxID=2629249 RepID=UPI000C9019F6|nr:MULTISPECIES: tRNA epoxyqueuosine(34) reductase QueG [unclassified Methylophaga]MAP26875.1 tRNA epoxyqueuosine(34) reductase QueG [Methylophaga sp.]|tara:strand:- start:44405 stop:45478 length:1074 start_codon:yes stop_codon:yes gene_type:complete
MADSNTVQLSRTLLKDMQIWARSLGFQQLGVSDIDLSAAEDQLQQWLARGFHGEMEFMQRHGSLRTHPEELMPGTIRVITARMDYWPETASDAWQVMGESELGFISRYALGRDYHKLIRKRLLRLSKRIEEAVGVMGYRVFTDSAPVMEKALAQKSGLGWIGKHTNVLNRQNGSYFFLGEIYTDLPLPLTEPVSDHCGSCTACIDICPTQAIVAPYELDARRCISYLTIELRGSIPVEFRPMMGNRIYGCDDCQLVCPWNKFAQMTTESAYLPREGLDAPQLVDLFAWTESEFLQRLEGSPIRRIGYECWLRNIAIALGNAKTSQTVLAALKDRIEYPSELVREHVQWALEQHNTPS